MFIMIWERTLYVLILLNLLKCVLLSRMRSLNEYSTWAWEEWLLLSITCSWLMELLNSTVSLFIFFLPTLYLSTSNRGLLRSPSIIVDSPIFSYHSINFGLLYLALYFKTTHAKDFYVFFENWHLYCLMSVFIPNNFLYYKVCSDWN